MFTCGAFGVYLRWFRLHSAGVHLSIPPVAPADVPAIFHPRIRTITCGALGCLPTVFRPRGAVFTCGADIYLRCFGDVYLRWGRDVYLRCFWCLPPVVSPTLGGSRFEYTSGSSCGRACNTRPRIWTSTCGATINYTFFPKNCILFERRTQNVRLMYYLCSVNTK